MDFRSPITNNQLPVATSSSLYTSNNNLIAFSDEQAKKLKAQDPNAFNEFYLETVDMFFRYINANYFVPKQDAEDIISDFYVKFREAVKSYNPEFSFTGYFWIIFRNTIKDYFKKSSEISFTDMKQDEESEDFWDTLIDEFDISQLLDNDYSFERIQQAMKDLDDVSKDIIYFKFIEEKSHEEISAITGIANDTIRQRISRAIKHLKQLLEE